MKRVESNDVKMPTAMLRYKYIMITFVILMASTLLVAVFALATNYKYANEMVQLRAQNQHNSDLVRTEKLSCNTHYTSGYSYNGTMLNLNETCRHLGTQIKAVYWDTGTAFNSIRFQQHTFSLYHVSTQAPLP